MASKADLKARSPWSRLNDVHKVEISPSSETINGQLTIPGSKSFTNRALIIAALAQGKSTLSGILKSDDSYWCIDTLRKLGTEIKVEDELVHIKGTNGSWPVQQGDLYIGAAGTIARFLPGALAAAEAGEWKLEASQRMSERPVRPLIEALKDLGADIEYLDQEGFFPLSINGMGLKGGPVNISGKVSSQFISGLLICSPYAKEAVQVNVVDHIVQHAYVNLTLDLMREFGAVVEADDGMGQFNVQPVRYQGRDVQLEADASTACYFLALAAITSGTMRINNLSMKTNQPDIGMVDVFEKMGCSVEKGADFIELKGTNRLKGGFTISMKEMSDQTLTLAAIAPFADGPITMKDVAHIRHHESDRIKVICESLLKLGIQTEEFEDGLTVYPGVPQPALLDSYDDHRVAMSLSLIGAIVPGISILDPGCISKTCPTFYEMVEKLGLQIKKTL
jgi:3-phosphoshikimate 1-carboxyvinyltransferase